MRGVNRYALFLLFVSAVLAFFYFTVISGYLSRSSFTYMYGTAPTQPISATETSDGVVVAFRALENGIVAKFSLKGEKMAETAIGEYPAVAAMGNEVAVLDDYERQLVKLDGRLERVGEMEVEDVPMRGLYATRSRLLLPVKRGGRDYIAFYDFDLGQMNSVSVPAQPQFSLNAYSYSFNGSCYVGVLEGDIAEIPDCKEVSVARGREIFALVDGERVLKYDAGLNLLGERRLEMEARHLAVSDALYVSSESQLAKYDLDMKPAECEVCREASGSPLFGFSDKGHYLLAKKGPAAWVVALK